jgi:hypothetical protein
VRTRSLQALLFATALLTTLLGACAEPSVVLRPDDPYFTDQMSRYHRTVALATKLAGPASKPAPSSQPTDLTLFEEAEGLYRYRFAFTGPTAGSYAAEVGAASLEFSPLDSLASSEGIDDLRLGAANGAAQIWETLLAWYPTSKLRPLTLYRLGWAYRNVSIDGLPQSSEDAFGTLVKGNQDPKLAQLATQALAVPYKTQDAAVAWSVIPGGGQMYVGKWGNGFVRLGIATFFAAVAVTPVVVGYEEHRSGTLSGTRAALLAGLSFIGLVGVEVSYTDAYQDAQHRALEYNERVERDFNAAHPDAP